jgi:hypothetical protein
VSQPSHEICTDPVAQDRSQPARGRGVPPASNLNGRNLLSLAVLGEEVLGVLRHALDDVGQSRLANVAAQLDGVSGRGASAEQVGGETGNVGAGHGGAVELLGAAAGHGGLDADARGEDVDKAAEVGEVGQGVGLVGGTYGAGRFLGGWRVVGGVSGVVAGGYGKEVAGADDGGGSLVDRGGEATTQRHVDNNSVGAVLLRGVLHDKIHTGNDTSARCSC